jgi:HSP20 family molecular chaperone IbpA
MPGIYEDSIHVTVEKTVSTVVGDNTHTMVAHTRRGCVTLGTSLYLIVPHFLI